MVCFVDRVRLGVFNVSMRIVEPAFLGKQIRQRVTDPEQLVMPVERGCDSKGCLEMVNGLRCLTLGIIYVTKGTMTMADQILFIFFGEEIDRAGCGFLCGVELLVLIQRPSEAVQTPCLIDCVPEPFVNSRCFSRLLYPFLIEAH